MSERSPAMASLLADEASTRELGRRLGTTLQVGDVVALCGPLGAGKTTMAQGLSHGLDVPLSVAVRSPTFALCHEYPGREAVLHIDLYRLGSPDEAEDLGFRERVGGATVAIVEWADKHPELLPEHTIWIELEHHPAGRSVTIWGEDDIDGGGEQWTAIDRTPPWERFSSRWF